MDITKILLFAVLCILLFLFFQIVFFPKKEKGCSRKCLPICDGRLTCLGGFWKCSTNMPDGCDPKQIPSCEGVRCVAGKWRCPGDYMGDCDISMLPENCEKSICVNGIWKCVDYTKPCNNRMKPICDDGEEAVCNNDGTWGCIKEKGCAVDDKPDCLHPMCSGGKWICYNKFPGASLSMLMDLTPTSGMGGMNLVVQQCDPLTADDCDPSYFLPISMDTPYVQNDYSGFRMKGIVPFTAESNITAFLWNIHQNPTPTFQMDLDFESCIMNGAGTDRCAINLVVIDINTFSILASCNILKNSSSNFKMIINSNSPLLTTDTSFPQYSTDWVFYFDSTLKLATVGFALQFSTTYEDMENSTFYNILPSGNNGPRSFIISSIIKNN